MSENKNSILIVCDQLVNFKKLPRKIRKMLPGYNSFKRLGIEFRNIYNNRQDCSPSRASMITSQLNVNISDNIDFSFQYDHNSRLSTEFTTIAHVMKEHGFKTAYYGKQHFDSGLCGENFTVPAFNTNTRRNMSIYGFDIFNTFGDSYYFPNGGIFTDNIIMDFKLPSGSLNYDFKDKTGEYIGVIPFLRSQKDKSFHLQVHFENPHDTQNFWQNFAENPAKPQLQFYAPYINEQIKLLNKNGMNISNPYIYDDIPSYVETLALITNFFEDSFEEYISNKKSLPFLESFEKNYYSNPEMNSIFPLFITMMESLRMNTSIPKDKDDIASWKNLINNYYALILQTDFYIYQIYEELEKSGLLCNTSVIIASDHGDLMSQSGQKQKGQHYDNGVNVAFLVYSPFLEHSQRNTSSSILGSLLDLAPTLQKLSGIHGNYGFLGKSLLDHDLRPRSENIPIFNIYNSWMTYLSYFYYPKWYISQPDYIKEKVIEQDNIFSGFFNFLGFYVMTVDIVEDKKYKLTRYFNFIEIIIYNYKYNPKFKDIISENLKGFAEEMTMNLEMFFGEIYQLNELLNTYSSPLEALDNSNDQIVKILLLNSMAQVLATNGNLSIMIPGYYSDNYPNIPQDFISWYNHPDTNYYFFLHNLTDDVEECINLLDKKHNRNIPENINVASILNNTLNSIIDKYNMVNFDMFISAKMFLCIIVNFKLFGYKINKYNESEFETLITCFGKAKTDNGETMTDYFDNAIAIINAHMKYHHET